VAGIVELCAAAYTAGVVRAFWLSKLVRVRLTAKPHTLRIERRGLPWRSVTDLEESHIRNITVGFAAPTMEAARTALLSRASGSSAAVHIITDEGHFRLGGGLHPDEAFWIAAATHHVVRGRSRPLDDPEFERL
jgi:hypothetical protein